MGLAMGLKTVLLLVLLDTVFASLHGDWWNQKTLDQILQIAESGRKARSLSLKPDDGRNQWIEDFEAEQSILLSRPVELIDCDLVTEGSCSKTCGKGVKQESYLCDFRDRSTGVIFSTDVSITKEVQCCCEPCNIVHGVPPLIRCCDLPSATNCAGRTTTSTTTTTTTTTTTPAPPDPCRCVVSPKDRVACPWNNNKNKCQDNGCCWNTVRFEPIKCFQPTGVTNEPIHTNCKTQAQAGDDLKNCGWRGVTIAECTCEGCCWRRARKTFWCYTY